MDARQRLNQLRGLEIAIDNRVRLNPNNTKQQLTDLRQKISFNNNRLVENLIGFMAKNTDSNRNQELIKDYEIIGPKNRRQTIKSSDVSLVDQKMPKVFLDLSRIDVNPRHAFDISDQPLVMSSSATVEPKSNANSVLVTNLSENITQFEINELFGKIGPIVSSKRIDSSVALIVFKNGVDARTAGQTYHNLRLDGLPMSCHSLSDTNNEFVVKTDKRVESTYYSELVAKQFQQINSLISHPITTTATQVFDRSRRPNTSSIRCTESTNKTKPKLIEMAISAIEALNQPNGSSLKAIHNYVSTHFDVRHNRKCLSKALDSGVANGWLEYVEGEGGLGLYKLADNGVNVLVVEIPVKSESVEQTSNSRESSNTSELIESSNRFQNQKKRLIEDIEEIEVLFDSRKDIEKRVKLEID